MTTKTYEKLIYWAMTAYVILLMGFSVQLYVIKHALVADAFSSYHYPAYLVYPLAAAKLGAIIVILANRWRNLKDIAYGAYFINMVMATFAHLSVGEQPVHAYIGLIAVPLSYIYSNRVRGVPRYEAFLLPARKG